ncbi:MAG TPA: mechanosensitive ion channel family protein [Pyrinomonadaceae bacterium]|nr:mechanosensitive ion channel family protein [Chloracidobacterium sp.]MBP9936295.1 mechanosensitive ion channel family protein [Pyrinomonadaceae bacterium]MBK7803715.1 mechanosensitive ion channel family protein [Chloracidobacterium sp.]MBK9439599.1 mechanosensitive ion channel family protein [Chloracidobacterium sp.]HQX54730.1 mechanosensitive ion channel family protein [Pyrinomonadaceae bacterium]
MRSSELQKKVVLFLIIGGTLSLFLIVYPLIVSPIRDYGVTIFGSTDGQMGETAATLIENFFRTIKVIVWMFLIISVVRLFDYIVFNAVLKNYGQPELSSLLRNVISIVIYIVAFFVIFKSQYPSIDLGAVFTTSTILGIVIGLALQDTLGNLFAGLAMQADQPFQVGDILNISNRGIGSVESVSWRGVKIRTFDHKLLVISNSVLGKETIEVAPKDNLNARAVFFGTLYHHSPAKTIQLVRDAVRQVENVSPKLKPVVRIRNLGENGLDWEVKYWVVDYKKYSDTDALIRQRIWYVFQRENIHFPFPTRTVHIEPKPEVQPVKELINSRFERLSRIAIFSPLSDVETEKLAAASKVKVYAPGEPIVRIGQEGNSMFVIIRGSVDVEIPNGAGYQVISSLGENDFFGEMSLLTGQPRSATVSATEETEVMQIGKNAIRPIFEANPDVVNSIVEIIDERRTKLTSSNATDESIDDKTSLGVLSSIRKFFGLRD